MFGHIFKRMVLILLVHEHIAVSSLDVVLPINNICPDPGGLARPTTQMYQAQQARQSELEGIKMTQAWVIACNQATGHMTHNLT